MNNHAKSLSLFVLAALAGCQSKSSSPSVTHPPGPTTARVTLANHSNSNKTYDALWDGSRIAVLGPGQSTTFDTAPGSHSYQFKVTNSGTPACTTANPNLFAGQSITYSCSF